jgi:hypothetical protein
MATRRLFDGAQEELAILPIVGVAGGAYTLIADGSSYSYSGNNANLLYNRILTADGGIYSYNGNNANLSYTPTGAYTLIADGGTYSYNGNNANTLYSRVLVADGGTYSYNGNNANLVYAPSGAYTLTAESGLYTYSGNNANLIYSGEQITGGHYYDFWHKKWAKQWERKTPTLEEVIEFIEEEPAQAIEAAATVAPKYASIQPETLKINEKLAENIANQILVAIKIQQIRIAQEEEDIETLLLIA